MSLNKFIITTSWDDGHPLDLKLAGLLQKYNVPATFYLPLKNWERQSLAASEIREIAGHFDIGSHTYHHIDLTRLDLAEAKNEIMMGKKELEQISGREISAFSYPFGRYNKQVAGAVKECGFQGARTIRIMTRRLKDPLRLGTMVNACNYFFSSYPLHTIAAGDFSLLMFIMKKNIPLRKWDRIAMETLEFTARKGGIWHLWGHSWEIDANNDWKKLESVLSMVRDFKREATKIDNSQLFKMGSRL